jgi:hypothetical protein
LKQFKLIPWPRRAAPGVNDQGIGTTAKRKDADEQIKAQQNVRPVSEIGGNQIIRASAPANIEPGSGGTYQVTVGIEGVQESRFIGTDIRLNAPECICLYVE